MNSKSSSYSNTVRRREEFFATEHLKSGIKQRSVRGGAIMLVVQAGKFFLQLSSTFVLARLLTPSDFGFIAMAAVVTGFVNLFKDMGLSMATVQKVEVTHAQVSTLFWINLGVVIALALGTAAIAPLVEWLYEEPGLTLVTIVLGSVIIFAGLSVQHQALLQRQMRYMSLGFIDLTSMFIGIVVGVVFAWHGAGYWALVAMTGATAASTAVPIFQVLAVGAFVEPLVHATGPALVAYGKTREYFRMGLINALSLLCCLTIGSFWGTMGIAIGRSTAVYLALVVCLVYAFKNTPVRIAPLLRRLLPNCFYSLLIFLVLLCARYAVGWFFLPQWLTLFAIAGASMYIGLWSVLPRGRRMLWDYWNYDRHAMPWMK